MKRLSLPYQVISTPKTLNDTFAFAEYTDNTSVLPRDSPNYNATVSSAATVESYAI